MRSWLAAIIGEIVGKQFRPVLLGSRNGSFDIHPQMIVVLNVKTTAVGGVCPIRSPDDRIGSGNGGCPWIRTNFLVRDDTLDLHDRTVCCSIQEQIEPSWSTEVLDIAISVSGCR